MLLIIINRERDKRSYWSCSRSGRIVVHNMH